VWLFGSPKWLCAWQLGLFEVELRWKVQDGVECVFRFPGQLERVLGCTCRHSSAWSNRDRDSDVPCCDSEIRSILRYTLQEQCCLLASHSGANSENFSRKTSTIRLPGLSMFESVRLAGIYLPSCLGFLTCAAALLVSFVQGAEFSLWETPFPQAPSLGRSWPCCVITHGPLPPHLESWMSSRAPAEGRCLH
jgi:hypothetical protein